MLAHIRTNLLLTDLWRAGRIRRDNAVSALEQGFAERFGFPFGLLFPYGRVALHALLTALEWRDREILCPAYTCDVVPHTVAATGNRVVYVDSAADHFLSGAEEWKAAASSQTAMAIVTPLFGYQVEKNGEQSIRSVAPNVFVLYDEAQSYGTVDGGGFQMRDADGALFSLGLGKFMSALTGGVLLLRDAALYRAVRTIRDGSRAASAAHTFKLITKGVASWTAFREPAVTFLERLSDWISLPSADSSDWAVPDVAFSAYQAEIGLQQFHRIDATIDHRRNIGEFYDRRLTKEGFRTFTHTHTPTWPRFPWPASDREATKRGLRSLGVQLGGFLSTACADMPKATLWARSMVNLPIWRGLTLTQAGKVIDALACLRDRNPAAVAWPGPSPRAVN